MSNVSFENAPTYDELRAENSRLREDLTNIVAQFRELKRQVFGRKSEKLSVLSLGQGQLFSAEVSELPVVEKIEIPAYKRSKRNGRKPTPRDLPRERIEYEPEQKNCSSCGSFLTKIGEEITEELEYLPARFFIREHVRIKCACPQCKEGVQQGDLPPTVQVLEKGRPGPGLLSQIMIAKYCDHIPLFRQEQIYRRHGVELSRSTMCDWVAKVADLLFPITQELKREILRARAIFADETYLKVQDPKREGLHTGYLWGALSPPGVYFHYSKSRAGAVAKELLGDYRGFVHTDAYAGYNPIFLPEHSVRVGCWAHVRRKFVEIQKLSPKACAGVLKRIADLYKIERLVRRLSEEERRARRQKESVSLLQKLKEYLDFLNIQTLPQHPLKKALEYALNQWLELTIYTTNGELQMDNNPIEQQIRPIALGRKNYLFAGSHEGAKRAAILYSIINTCKMHKVNPFDYIKDVLVRVHTHPAVRIGGLLPHRWKEKFA